MDIRAAELLSDYTSGLQIADIPVGPKVTVVGAGIESPKDLEQLTTGKSIIWAADGATTACLEASIVPHVIVTDLDGNMSDILHCIKEGSIPIVHAHGDNMDELQEYVPLFNGSFLPTCQCRTPQGLYNFGGFTDGDRAVCAAAALGAREITLYGFSFDRVGKYSFHSNDDIKIRKLRWAKRIIDELSYHTKAIIRHQSLSRSL